MVAFKHTQFTYLITYGRDTIDFTCNICVCGRAYMRVRVCACMCVSVHGCTCTCVYGSECECHLPAKYCSSSSSSVIITTACGSTSAILDVARWLYLIRRSHAPTSTAAVHRESMLVGLLCLLTQIPHSVASFQITNPRW